MATPVITELKINPGTSIDQVKALIRNSIAIAGFGTDDYDNFDNYGQHWVIEYVWNPNKPKGRIYIDFHLHPYTYSLGIKLHNDWDILTHSSTNNGTSIYIDLIYDPANLYFPLNITVINHPEIKGFIWSQLENCGSLYFVQPKYIYEGFGYNDVDFPWAYVANSDLTSVVEAQPNPFQDGGEREVEIWSQLKFRNFQVEPPTHQIVPSPRILSPSQVGFIGAFSQDVCLVASNALSWKKIITVGVKSYLLLRPREYSGIAISLN